MPQEVGIERLWIEDVAVDLAVVGRIMLDRKNLERILELVDEARVEEVCLIPEATRRRCK